MPSPNTPLTVEGMEIELKTRITKSKLCNNKTLNFYFMKKIITLLTVLIAAFSVQAQDTWTIAGVSAICGSSWNPADESNDMTATSATTFELVKQNCVLEKNTNYEYKVVKNHSWTENYPGSNAILTVTETASYTVTFKFDADSKELSATATKTGEAVVGEKTWTVAGEEALVGVEWAPSATENDMTKQADGSFKLVKTGVALLADTEYKFKIAANHAWDESYGLNGGSANAVLSVSADDTYDVTFVFDPNTTPKKVEATAVKSSSTGINAIETVVDQNTPAYNLSGQRVQSGYRGIVVRNGRKFAVK